MDITSYDQATAYGLRKWLTSDEQKKCYRLLQNYRSINISFMGDNHIFNINVCVQNTTLDGSISLRDVCLRVNRKHIFFVLLKAISQRKSSNYLQCTKTSILASTLQWTLRWSTGHFHHGNSILIFTECSSLHFTKLAKHKICSFSLYVAHDSSCATSVLPAVYSFLVLPN